MQHQTLIIHLNSGGNAINTCKKIMMYNEFTELAGFKVNETYYYTVIEPKYMASELNKQDFVKQWKKQGGIQQAYDVLNSEYVIERAHHEAAEKAITEFRDELDSTKDALVIAQQERDSNWDMVKRSSERIEELEAQERTARREKKELMYFLIDRSEKGSDAELREFVIKEIGFKKYIAYKMEQGYNLWQLDRDEILKNL